MMNWTSLQEEIKSKPETSDLNQYDQFQIL
jgi:hypothetical protein